MPDATEKMVMWKRVGLVVLAILFIGLYIWINGYRDKFAPAVGGPLGAGRSNIMKKIRGSSPGWARVHVSEGLWNGADHSRGVPQYAIGYGSAHDALMRAH